MIKSVTNCVIWNAYYFNVLNNHENRVLGTRINPYFIAPGLGLDLIMMGFHLNSSIFLWKVAKINWEKISFE